MHVVGHMFHQFGAVLLLENDNIFALGVRVSLWNKLKYLFYSFIYIEQSNLPLSFQMILTIEDSLFTLKNTLALHLLQGQST
jgi:hypothetical protein